MYMLCPVPLGKWLRVVVSTANGEARRWAVEVPISEWEACVWVREDCMCEDLVVVGLGTLSRSLQNLESAQLKRDKRKIS